MKNTPQLRGDFSPCEEKKNFAYHNSVKGVISGDEFSLQHLIIGEFRWHCNPRVMCYAEFSLYYCKIIFASGKKAVWLRKFALPFDALDTFDGLTFLRNSLEFKKFHFEYGFFKMIISRFYFFMVTLSTRLFK